MQVLVADDDPVTRTLIRDTLQQWEYEVVAVDDGRSAWEVLRSRDSPPLALLDWMMPGFNGIDLCRMVRNRSESPFTYLVLLTGRSNTEDIVKGIESGADDYISKPFDPLELKVRLRAGQRIIEMHRALLDQATRDPLTRAWNRRAIDEILVRELARACRDGTSVAVAMVDIDHFKRVNDTYGHTIGDLVLRNTASRLTNVLRPSDSIGRFGGEEFCIVLPDCTPVDALATAERVRRAIAEHEIRIPDAMLSITVSIGVAGSAGTAIDAQELVENADKALYRAKREGRNRINGDTGLSCPSAAV